MGEGVTSSRGGLAGFYGRFRLKLDVKGRLTLPSIYRRALGAGPDEETWLVLRKGAQGFVQVIPHETWDATVRGGSGSGEATGPATGLDRQWQRRLQFSEVEIATLDPKGRFTVPQELVEFTGAERDVIVVGTGRLMEIWDPQKFFALAEQNKADQTSIDDALYA